MMTQNRREADSSNHDRSDRGHGRPDGNRRVPNSTSWILAIVPVVFGIALSAVICGVALCPDGQAKAPAPNAPPMAKLSASDTGQHDRSYRARGVRHDDHASGRAHKASPCSRKHAERKTKILPSPQERPPLRRALLSIFILWHLLGFGIMLWMIWEKSRDRD